MPEDQDIFNGLSQLSDQLNPQLPPQLNVQQPDQQKPLSIPDLDIDPTGLGTPSQPRKIANNFTFQPANTDWSLDHLSTVQDYFQNRFGRPLPVSVKGQGPLQTKWNLDHRNSADIGLNPNSKEGQDLMGFLRNNNIPYLAFDHAIPGVASGPHIHVGLPSQRNVDAGSFAVGQTLNDATGNVSLVNFPQIDVTGLDQVVPHQDQSEFKDSTPTPQVPVTVPPTPKFTGKDAAGNIITDQNLPKDYIIDPKQLTFKAGNVQVPALLSIITSHYRPTITGVNPNQPGDVIRTIIDRPQTFDGKPTVNQLTDAWLNAWNPRFKALNDQYRKETGGLNIALVDSRANYEFKPNNKLEIASRPTRAVEALFTAYSMGGIPALMATNALIDKQFNESYSEQVEIARNQKAILDAHPYLAATLSGVEGAVTRNTHFWTNITYLGAAIGTGLEHGYDSQNYLDLINEERDAQATIAGTESYIYKPTSFAGKVLAGAAGGLVDFPRAILATQIGGAAGLPLMIYVENLHNGNSAAAMQALPMAVMAGIPHGLGEFGKGFEFRNVNLMEDLGEGVEGPTRVVNRNVPIETGGTAAPFRYAPRVAGQFTREDLSLFTNRLVQGESQSIANLSPMARQFIFRGTNALMGGAAGIVSKFLDAKRVLDFKDPHSIFTKEQIGNLVREGAADFVVGGAMPIGEAAKQFEVPSYYGEFPGYGIGQRRLGPIAEGPETPTFNVPTTFEKSTEPNVIKMPLDDANLRLLELKRMLADGSWRQGKVVPLKEALTIQQNLKTAITFLEKAIPLESRAFFEQNEKAIRAAIESNGQRTGNVVKKNALPSEVNQSESIAPKIITGQESTQELFAGKSGDNNKSTSQVGMHTVMQDMLDIMQKATGQKAHGEEVKTEGGEAKGEKYKEGSFGTFGTGLGGAKDAIERTKKDIQAIFQASKDGLSYMSAFFYEDMRLRGLTPNINSVISKVAESLGQFGEHISADLAKEIFENGKAYYLSNQADPFFLKMKQHVAERLPNIVNEIKDQIIPAVPAKPILHPETKEPIFTDAGIPKVFPSKPERIKTGKTASDQVREFFGAHQKEMAWTTGLEPFLQQFDKGGSKEGEGIKKQDLIDVINAGQMQVKLDVADNVYVYPDDDYIMQSLKREQGLILRDSYDSNRNKSRTQEEFDALDKARDSIQAKIDERQVQIDNDNRRRMTQWDLKTYTDEKLELPGGTNPSEVKLISPVPKEVTANVTPKELEKRVVDIWRARAKDQYEKTGYPDEANQLMYFGEIVHPHAGDTSIEEFKTKFGVEPEALDDHDLLMNAADKDWDQANKEFGLPKGYITGHISDREYYQPIKYQTGVTYEGGHFEDTANIIAHYRANDRTTVDGINVKHSEEFQSDQNQEIQAEYAAGLLGVTKKYNIPLPEGKQDTEFGAGELENLIRDYTKGLDQYKIIPDGMGKHIVVDEKGEQVYINNKPLKFDTEKKANDFIVSRQRSIEAAVTDASGGVKRNPLPTFAAAEKEGYKIRTIAQRDGSYKYELIHPNGAFLESEYGPKKSPNDLVKNSFLSKLNDQRMKGMEPNPFMKNDWKEVDFKAFVRDAATAKREYRVVRDANYPNENVYNIFEGKEKVKDRNGNDAEFGSPELAQDFVKSLPIYKYDGVTWTTSAQQTERYKNVYIGKDFSWRKNPDGTYSFNLHKTHPVTREVTMDSPHELSRISLARFAQLTTPEAAQEVREQEKIRLDRYVIKDDLGKTHGSFSSLDEAKADMNMMIARNEAIQGNVKFYTKGLHVVKTQVPKSDGSFNLNEAIEVRKSVEGKDKYKDYDEAMVNIANDLGEPFGASHSMKTIPTPTSTIYTGSDGFPPVKDALAKGLEVKGKLNYGGDWMQIQQGDNLSQFSKFRVYEPNKTEDVHFLPIPDSMRESLEKQGYSFYGTGKGDPLTGKDPTGIRNKLTTSEGFNEHREALVKALKETIPTEPPEKSSPIESDDGITTKMEVIDAQGNSHVVVGIDSELIKVLAKKLYEGEIGTIVVKELLQNAADAIKGARFRGLPTEGRIKMTVDSANRTINIVDDGIGMPRSVMVKEFSDLGGTVKQALDTSSGGYGIAKAAMFFNAEQIKVTSVYKNPETGNFEMSILSGSADDWLRPATDVSQKGLDIKSENLGSHPDERTGTRIELKLKDSTPDNQVSFKRGNIKDFMQDFMHSHRLGMDINLDLDGTQVVYEDSPRQPVELKKTLTVDGADIDIYTSNDSEKTSAVRVTLLNHGLPQGQTYIGLGEELKMPTNVVIDVKSTGGPKTDNYPWSPSRESLRGAANQAINRYFGHDLLLDAIAAERENYQRALKESEDVPNTSIYPIRETEADTGYGSSAHKRMKAAIAELFPNDPNKMHDWQLDDDELALAKLVFNRKLKEERAQTGAPTNQKIVDTNENQPLPKDLLNRIANNPLVQTFTNAISTISRQMIESLDPHHENYKNAEYYGFGLGGDYLAVNVKGEAVYGEHAKNIFLVNPISIIDTVERMFSSGQITENAAPQTFARLITSAMVHELTHQKSRGHDARFTTPFTINTGLTLDAQWFGSRTLEAILNRNDGELYEQFRQYNSEVNDALAAAPDKGTNIFDKITSDASTRTPEPDTNKSIDERNGTSWGGLQENISRSIAGGPAKLGNTESGRNIPSGKWKDSPYVNAGKVDTVPIDWLKQFAEYDRRTNPKLRSEDFLNNLKKDIKQNGLNEPLILVVGKQDGKVLLSEGNTRLAALEDLGYTHIPVRVEVQSYAENGKEHPMNPKAGEYFKAEASPSEVFNDIPNDQQALEARTENPVEAPKQITAQYMSHDGHTETRTFTGENAEKEAREFIDYQLGGNVELSPTSNYAVDHDGFGRIAISGTNITNLYPERAPSRTNFANAEYVAELPNTALKLNVPEIFNQPGLKVEDSYYNGGKSLTFDWQRGNKKGRFIFSVDNDLEASEGKGTRASVNLFYTDPDVPNYAGYPSQVRVLDKAIEFESTGNQQEDLAKVESLLKHPEIQKFAKEIQKGAVTAETPENRLPSTSESSMAQRFGDTETSKKATEDIKNSSNKGTVFNSGLSPDAFIDQTKLLYRGIKDFGQFSSSLIQRFGEQVRPYLHDLWIQVKELWHKFNYEGSTEKIDELNLNLNPMTLLKKSKLFREKPLAEEEYREQHPRRWWDDPRIQRGIAIAQTNPVAGTVYEIMRMGQRDKNAFEYANWKDLNDANKIVKSGKQQAVADNILIGNENQRLYSDTELRAGDRALNRPALDTEQIEAYKSIYKAEHRSLDREAQKVLFGYQQRDQRLNDNLQNLNPNDPSFAARQQTIQKQIADNQKGMQEVVKHYNDLKNEGYISLKRKGPIAAFVQDPAFPKGDVRGKVYRQFDTITQAGIWVKEQERLLGANEKESTIYNLNEPERLRAAAQNLTPAQFESLIDAAGVNSHSKAVQDLRDEVYSRYPAASYQLKRDYIRGYDRNWQFVVGSVADQTETYGNSFYARVVGEHAIKQLSQTGLQTTDYLTYKVMQKYIDHEISSPEKTWINKQTANIRKGVYLYQLGFDFNQLYLNAVAQPITQTYNYFARVESNGQRLTGFEAEKYWIKAWKLSGEVAKDRVSGTNKAPQDFVTIKNRLIAEGVITPEFTKSLAEGKALPDFKSKLEARNAFKTYEHWAGAFMRAGETTTRMHAAAEAFLVGKEKFGLQNEELVNFIVRAVDATQSNPTRGENPLAIRGSQNTGEARKLFYQFNAFNHMWVESLAMNIKADFKNRAILSSATARQLIPVAIMGGLVNLPLAGVAGGIYTIVTGKDPRKEFHKYMNNFPLLEKVALHGMTGNATLGARLTPSLPIVDQIKLRKDLKSSVEDTLSLSQIPAVATAGQIAKGIYDILGRGEYLRGATPLVPNKLIRNLMTEERIRRHGIQTRRGTTVIPKRQLSTVDLIMQGAGLAPTEQTDYYEKESAAARTTIWNPNYMKRLRKKILK